MIFYLNNFNVFSLFCIRLYKKNKIIKYWRLQTVRYIILLKYEILLLNNIKINLKYTINIYMKNIIKYKINIITRKEIKEKLKM